MKLFMATMGLDIGGAETHIVELCKELRRQGHDVAVCSNGGVYVQALLDAGIRHYDAPMHNRQFCSMKTAHKLLKQAILAEQPDVVHAHARIPAFLCGSLQKSLKFPFVTTAHGVYSARGLLRLMTNWGQQTLAVSEDIQSYLIQNYGLSPNRIALTINGVDTTQFIPTAPIPVDDLTLGDGPVISHVCRLDFGNEHVCRVLIEIAPLLARAIPNVQLLLVGGGTAFTELSSLAQKANEQIGYPCIQMTGPRTDIFTLLSHSDLFVGVSRAALEAMSMELPVLLAGPQGYGALFTEHCLADAIDSNFCFRGTHLATGDELFEAITAAFALPETERKALGVLGRETVLQHYSVGRMASDCLAMYQKVTAPRPTQLLLSGYYGFSNAGDDAILQAITQELSAEHGLEITVLSKNPAQTQADYGLNAIPRFRLPAVLSALRHCDILLSGGGSLIQDRTSTRSLLYYLSLILGAKFFRKPVMLYANGIGPVQKKGNRKLVRHTVEMANLVTLRDHNSLQELREIGVTRDDLVVTADPVFHLLPAPVSVAQDLLSTTGMPQQKPFVAVSIRNWMNVGDFPAQLALLCDHLHRTHGLEILFVLMQPSHDLDISRAVMSQMKCPAYLLEDAVSPTHIMAVLGEATLCLAMRLHTLIFAAHMGVPTVGIDYDPKVASFLQELGLPSAGKVDAFSGETAITVTDTLIQNIDDYRTKLAQTAENLSQSADENQRILLDFLNQNTNRKQ